jgi:hypothetical protein
VNGWIKSLAGMAQTKHRGLPRVRWMFQLKVAAYNLIRLPGCWSQHKCAHLSSQLSLGCPAKDRQFPDHNINPLSTKQSSACAGIFQQPARASSRLASGSASFALVGTIRIDQSLAAGLNPCGLVPNVRNSSRPVPRPAFSLAGGDWDRTEFGRQLAVRSAACWP